MVFLQVKDLNVSIDGKKILNGLNLEIDKNEVKLLWVLMDQGKVPLQMSS